MLEIDFQIRNTAFEWLKEITIIKGEVLNREILEQGFIFEGNKVPLVSPQGIFKPQQMELPLSITTAPNSHYEDSMGQNEYLNYKYRGTNINHRDNIGLRECMRQGVPLIYFLGLVPGKYLSIWPVYIIGDNPTELSFTVAADELNSIMQNNDKVKEPDGKKLYITTMVKARLHQQKFREKVLFAYQTQCALCRLKHEELLDAAHIIPDNETESRPTVDNGIALCKLHHAAFDKYFIGINADYVVVVRKDILEEADGPMLQHGLKNLNHKKILLPHKILEQPNKHYLDFRYQKFLKSF